MKLGTAKSDVWMVQIADRPGALADKLEALADAGADLELVVARRTPEQPGRGILFVAPLKGTRQSKAALQAGFEKSPGLVGLRVDGPNQPGLGAKVARALADAGINLRGLSGAAVGNKSVLWIALDSSDDAAKAARALKKLA